MSDKPLPIVFPCKYEKSTDILLICGTEENPNPDCPTDYENVGGDYCEIPLKVMPGSVYDPAKLQAYLDYKANTAAPEQSETKVEAVIEKPVTSPITNVTVEQVKSVPTVLVRSGGISFAQVIFVLFVLVVICLLIKEMSKPKR